MSLYVILLLLAIQGLVPSCCAGHNSEEVSGEGPWKEEDWSGSSGSSTGEDDNFTGFDSGWSSADRGRNDEDPRTNPRNSRTYSNKRFVTSGVGEDKGGPQDDEGSQSKSNGSQDQESGYENFESNMNLANVGDAIDVMKKLKKAKSDQEFAKKLRSGPESLGVAFKTFEQLSGLWISVMHRIWRVWKAKGAKVVMHSMVHDLINNTGKAIKRKVGSMLSKNLVVDLSSSGWTTFKDEGSTEPDHSPATIHNHTGPSVERLSIDFRKNTSKEAKTLPSTKRERAPVEKVKVSFFSGKANDSKVIQQTSIQRNPKRVPGQSNNSSLAQETLAGSAKQNITNKKEKSSRAVDTRSMVVSNIKNKNSTTKRSEHIPDTNSSLDSRDNEKKALKNYVGDVGKIEETTLSHTEHEVTQHTGDNNSKRNQTEVNTNGDQIPNYNVSNSVTQSQSGVAHVLEETNKQVPVGHSKQSTEQFIENDKNSRTNTESRNNETSSTSVNNVTQEMVSKRSNVAGNKTGKTRMLETLKINFLRKNRTSHWNQNTTSSSEENALETQRNVKLDNETNSKADSDKVVASSKSSPAGGNDKKRASVLDKKNSNLHKLDVKDEPIAY
ncbi:uncharacterized protein LOC110042789 [Orbicella faveolata]|uniref:uncharacterized protein LOC110042789 n=1 Tax=Orbicella faveolata TaxID=48498 RepID=UPI0009E2B745|nr:uncharacterized protein LOC110042789 [Orbicella faveolata]